MKSSPSFEIKIVLLKVHKEYGFTMIFFSKINKLPKDTRQRHLTSWVIIKWELRLWESALYILKQIGFYFVQTRGGGDAWASSLLSEPDACLRSFDSRELWKTDQVHEVHTHGRAQENTYSLTHTTVINKIIFKTQTITNDEKDMECLEASSVTGQDRTWCCSESSSAVLHVLTTHTPHDHQFHS